MDMHPRHAGLPRDGGQIAPTLRRQDELRMTRQRRHRQRHAARGRFQHQVIRFSRVPLDQIVHMFAHPAFQIVGNGQGRGQARGSEQRHGDGETKGFVCPGLDVARDERGVLGIASDQQGIRARDPSIRPIAEVGAAVMRDERVAGDTMRPARRQGAQTEVVFLPITFAEGFFVEQTDFVQPVAAEIHTEPDGGRCFSGTAGVHLAARRVDGIQGHARRDRRALVAQVTADRRVVGQWRNAGDFRRRVSLCPQTVQPAGGDLGIAVQQDDVTRRRSFHRQIHRRDETKVFFVADQLDPTGRSACAQPGRQSRLGRAVVDDQDPARGTVRVPQH